MTGTNIYHHINYIRIKTLNHLCSRQQIEWLNNNSTLAQQECCRAIKIDFIYEIPQDKANKLCSRSIYQDLQNMAEIN